MENNKVKEIIIIVFLRQCNLIVAWEKDVVKANYYSQGPVTARGILFYSSWRLVIVFLINIDAYDGT